MAQPRTTSTRKRDPNSVSGVKTLVAGGSSASVLLTAAFFTTTGAPVPAWGVIASILTVAVLWLWWLEEALTGEFLLGGKVMPVTVVLGASTLALVVVTLLTPPPPKDLQARFFPES